MANIDARKLEPNSDPIPSLLKLTPDSPASLVVNIGAITALNAAGVNLSIPPIAGVIPSFASGSITFPSAPNDDATVSPGTNTLIPSFSSGNYLKVLICVDASGDIIITPGTEGVSVAAATLPETPEDTFPVGYVVLHNTAGAIDNVAASAIYQFVGGGGGGGASSLVTPVIDTFASDGTDDEFVLSETPTDPAFLDLFVGGPRQTHGEHFTLAGDTVTLDSPAPASPKAELTLQGLYLQAVAYGKTGNLVSIEFVDPAANSQSLDVSVTSNKITVSLATNGGGTITSTVSDIVTAINADAQANLLVAASGSGSSAVTAASETFLSGGVNDIVAVIRNY